MAFNNEQINAIIREDDLARTRLHEDYSPELTDVIANNFDNVRTCLTVNSRRFCSEIQYRFANRNRPTADSRSRNFWPSPINYQTHLINFVRSVLLLYFARTRTALYINFAFSSCLIDVEQEDTHFFWASRSNFGALDSSFLIHSIATLNHFVDNILGPFDLGQFMVAMCETLGKYDD